MPANSHAAHAVARNGIDEMMASLVPDRLLQAGNDEFQLSRPARVEIMNITVRLRVASDGGPPFRQQATVGP